MRDHYHHLPAETGYCEHCGQPLPGSRVLSYGERKPVSRAGIAVTIGVHLALLLAFLFKPDIQIPIKPPAGGEITYVTPLEGKPKPKEAAPAPAKPQPKPRPAKPERTAPVQVKRLPDTITLPDEQPVKVVEKTPEPPKPTVDPNEDMSAAIEARRRARGQDSTTSQGEESEADRGKRIALANIAAANAKSVGNDTGGIFSVENKTFASADVKFRGWNSNFKRKWLQQVRVERGSEPDIEHAIIKKMIELIRKEKPGDFEWDSYRLQRVVKMSARVEDQAELEAFLFKEMFPNYTPPRR